MAETSDRPLRILHAVRAPVGGIFRHIMDLASGQAERGHHVGIIADSLTGGERAEAALQEIAPRLKLGVRRIAIRREPHPADLLVWLRFMFLIRRLKPDVLHGHGAKAGAFVRLRRRSKNKIRIYTPHGGSLHYPLDTLKGAFYSRLERALMNNTELFLFESAFARDTYQRTIGMPKGLVRCVFNGVTADEFDPIVKAADATDVAYVGEFRHIKGADLLIDAVARLRADGKPVTLTLGGDGEEMSTLKAKVQKHGLAEAIHFIGHVKARYGFSKGRLLVVPSRGDSMPYVVIEAAAAGIPMVAANVGGIPEIFGPYTDALFAPNSVGAMADAIETALSDPAAAQDRAKSLARESSFISRRRRWSKACWRVTATRLQNVNHPLPAITVSSDLSVKPRGREFRLGARTPRCLRETRTWEQWNRSTHARCWMPRLPPRRIVLRSSDAAGCRRPHLPSPTRKCSGPIRRS